MTVGTNRLTTPEWSAVAGAPLPAAMWVAEALPQAAGRTVGKGGRVGHGRPRGTDSEPAALHAVTAILDR